MSVDIIRLNILKYLNEEHSFIYVGSRGLYDSFSGKIITVYPRTFIIRTDTGIIKSFSYSDYLIKVLRIVQ